MEKGSKTKVYPGESEFAKLTDDSKVPLSRIMKGFKNDVILPNGWTVEVKRKKVDSKQFIAAWKRMIRT